MGSWQVCSSCAVTGSQSSHHLKKSEKIRCCENYAKFEARLFPITAGAAALLKATADWYGVAITTADQGVADDYCG